LSVPFWSLLIRSLSAAFMLISLAAVFRHVTQRSPEGSQRRRLHFCLFRYCINARNVSISSRWKFNAYPAICIIPNLSVCRRCNSVSLETLHVTFHLKEFRRISRGPAERLFRILITTWSIFSQVNFNSFSLNVLPKTSTIVQVTKQNYFRWTWTGSKKTLVFTVHWVISVISKEKLLAYSYS